MTRFGMWTMREAQWVIWIPKPVRQKSGRHRAVPVRNRTAWQWTKRTGSGLWKPSPEPNRFVGFDSQTQEFFSITEIDSGGGTIRNMMYYLPGQEVWFGTDMNTVGRAQVR